MTKTYTVDEHGVKHELDHYDFLTNDDNPTLKRLADKMMKDPAFMELFKDEDDD